MGLLVPEFTVSGVSISNVYVSLVNNNITVCVNPENRFYVIQGLYSVYKDRSRQYPALINKLFQVRTDDHTSSLFTLIYNQLKEEFPGSIDVIEDKDAAKNFVYDEEIGALRQIS